MFDPHIHLALFQHILGWKVEAVDKVLLIVQDGYEFIRHGEEFILVFQHDGDDAVCHESLVTRGVTAFGVQDAGTNDGGEVGEIHLAASFLIDM